jgi:hypothetical protein
MTDFIDWSSDIKELNKAMELPNKLIDPDTGRVFMIQSWSPEISVGHNVSYSIEAILIKENKK